jgi:hypothetical protein
LLSAGGTSEGSAPIPNLKRDVREWYDYGKDTGRRLRVKGLVDVDALPVVKPEPDTSGPDPREVEELHRQSREAMAEGDDRKLGKLYEDLLDALHSKDLPSEEDPITKVRHDLRAAELEGALGAELAELGRGRRWAVGYKMQQSGAGEVVLVVGVREKVGGAHWLVTVDQRALYNAVRRAGAEMRAAAREIATHVRAEVDRARAGAIVGTA